MAGAHGPGRYRRVSRDADDHGSTHAAAGASARPSVGSRWSYDLLPVVMTGHGEFRRREWQWGHGLARLVLLLERVQGFLPNQVQTLAFQSHELGAGQQRLFPGAGQFYVDIGDDPARAGAHHYNPVGEKHRF